MNKNNDIEQFKDNAIKLIDYIADYYKNIEEYPVKSQIKPGDIYSNFENNPPMDSRNFDEILNDFDNKIMAGITHWQSPNFYAYFNANSSFPSLLGEILTAALGVNVFSWETSPAGTELEQRVMEWLRDAIGLPNYFSGVIQDTASTATLVSLLTAREKYSNFEINKSGFSKDYKFRIYCSSEAHSSIEKDVRIAGFGSDNLIKIELNEDYSINYHSLEKKIIDDLNNGYTPLAVISAIGTTGTTAIDNINEIGKICKKHNVWHHVDAAHLGSALLLEENRHWIDGIENCDTFVFNPHKWMFTNFDYSAYFVKDKESLTKTFDILPEYLKINVDNVNNYKDWGIQLGRRFRSLKMWFVLNSFGINGIKEKIKYHISLAEKFENLLKSDSYEYLIPPKQIFQIMAPRVANLVTFRWVADENLTEANINELNIKLVDKINSTGKIFLTKTKINNKIIIRMNIGQTYTEERHIIDAFNLIYKIIMEW